MAKLYLSLGSNLGDREKNIRTALELLDIAFGRHWKAVSPIINTKADGFDGPDFLNAVVCYESRRNAENILRICKDVERLLGRTDSPEYDSEGQRIYHDRTIDIDILLYGSLKMDTEMLRIPHPQVENRPFIKELLLLLQDCTPQF